jgi:hypothetical protein
MAAYGGRLGELEREGEISAWGILVEAGEGMAAASSLEGSP